MKKITIQHYNKIENILNSYEYSELVIVINRHTNEIIGIEGVSKNSNFYDTVVSIIKGKTNVSDEKIKSKINKLHNVVTFYDGDFILIGDLIVYAGRAVRRNKECSCGRNAHYGCNIHVNYSKNMDRFCSTCILDYLIG